jgi:plastocyanin
MKNANEWMRVKGCLILLSALSLVTGSMAADYTVYMESYGLGSFRFRPDSLEIQVGDTVTWRNEDYTQWGYLGYDATCYWGSQILWTTDWVYPGESSSITFPYVETYFYEDSDYGAYGMTGTLVVNSAQPPTVEPVKLLAPQRLVTGQFQCVVSNLVVGTNYVMQVSTNLVDWVNLVTNSATASVETFTDNPPMASRVRFYRAGYLP